ncbi:MAG: hypothetical protein L6R19_25600 [Alphaproteobacteria bacterium]|nr:hypothetical protein [Alphaproteobacteria bacterium]
MALKLKHPTTQDLPQKLPREFLGQWQDVVETPEYRFIKEIEIREEGSAQIISGMAELSSRGTLKDALAGTPIQLVVNYFPGFTLREQRPRRLKAWFEVSTTVEPRTVIEYQGKPIVTSFRLPAFARTMLLRFKIDGTRLKIGTVEGQLATEGLDFHVTQAHDLVGGYRRVG